MTEIKIGYTPTVEGAIGLAAIMRVLTDSTADFSFVDCDEKELEHGLKSGEFDFAVPVIKTSKSSGVRLLSQLYKQGAILCKVGVDEAENNKLEKGTVFVASNVEKQWKDLQETDQELASLSASIVSFEEIISLCENKKQSCMIFIPTPCDLIHLKNVTPYQSHSISEEEAYIAAAEGIDKKVDSLSLDELSQLLVGNTVMSALMWAVECDGQEPEQAISSWQRGHLIGR